MSEDKQRRSADLIFSALIYIFVIITTIVNGYICSQNLMEILSDIIVSFIGVYIFTGFFKRNDYDIVLSKSSVRWFLILFIVSEALIVAQNYIFTGTLWLAAAVYLSFKSDIKYALASYGLLLMQYALLVLKHHKDINLLIFSAVFGIVLLFTFAQINEIKNIPYAFAVIMLLSLILIIVQSEFDIKIIKDNISTNVILLLCNIVFTGAVIIRYGRGILFNREAMNHKEKLHKRLMKLLETDNVLINSFHEYSVELFSHSMKVSMISRDAAETVGADEVLAQAGGMFHEIGRMNNKKDYVKEGVSIGKKYGFPKELIHIIKQHSAGNDCPETEEAAIVMLSDCILSSNEFFVNKGKRDSVSDRQLVESVFNNRIKKGSLSKSGLTEDKIDKLKEYYINNAFDN